ncbi:MAG: DHH family phosphoesterase [Spirochaetes bacterium]|nr:DHH family phosphoesterase [Spirochaetota bacterium]
MAKRAIKTIKEKNTIIKNIITAMVERKGFLLIGHKNPDEDCIASMVAFAILLRKFDKRVQIYINSEIPRNVDFLANICVYNGIRIVSKKQHLAPGVDSIIACDTPKPPMLDITPAIQKRLKSKMVLRIEIDHHLGADSNYIGDEGYCLVTEASSSSELVGLIALKLKSQRDILSKFIIADPLSRNFVLAVLTGIIGDTNMGKYLKSKREKKYYAIFSNIYNDILMKTTVRESNFTNIDQVYYELQKLSEKEAKCYGYIIQKQQMSPSVSYVVLRREDMEYLTKEYDRETIINTTKSIVNDLAEISQKVGIIAFPEKNENTELIQFRMRRSYNFKEFDLRKILEIFSISNGGGHEGAIGFRFPANEIADIDGYMAKLVEKLEQEIG